MDSKQTPFFLHSQNNLFNTLSLAISRKRNNLLNEISHIFFFRIFVFFGTVWMDNSYVSFLVNLYCSAEWSNNPETIFGRFSSFFFAAKCLPVLVKSRVQQWRHQKDPATLIIYDFIMNES